MYIFLSDTDPLLEENRDEVTTRSRLPPALSMRTKCQLFPRMARFIVPLALVYLFEYFINQGLVK